MDWSDDDGRWTVRTDRGDRLRARFVITATGPLHRPKLPGVPGIGDFAGPSFHTSRWDYAVTGGGPEGGLDRLGGLRVAVIGTGATAVQIVPHLAGAAGHLLVFQRTPSSVDVRGNRPTDPAWVDSLRPGWQEARVRNFNALVSGVPQDVDLVDDGWTTLIGRMMEIYRDGRAGALDRPFEEVLELANFEKMEEIRARVDALVDDPATAEALKPYYKMFCKRPCFHDEYLTAFNRDDVTLVDTDGRGVERITTDGVVAGGVHYGVDCIIYATGFEVGTGYERRAGFAIRGRDGRTLTEKWDDEGMRTLHGMLTHGYPNLFLVSQSQGAWTANYTQLLDEASRHLAGIVAHMGERGFATVEATAAAEDAWAHQIVAHAVNGTGGIGGTDCTPGYYNNEGRPLDGPPWSASYGRGSIEFFRPPRPGGSRGRSTGWPSPAGYRPPDRLPCPAAPWSRPGCPLGWRRRRPREDPGCRRRHRIRAGGAPGHEHGDGRTGAAGRRRGRRRGRDRAGRPQRSAPTWRDCGRWPSSWSSSTTPTCPDSTGGYVGVDVFFVISGFVITGLLLRERSATSVHVAALASTVGGCGGSSRRPRWSSWPRSSPPTGCSASCTGDPTAVAARWTAVFLANFHFASDRHQLPHGHPAAVTPCRTSGRSPSRSSSTWSTRSSSWWPPRSGHGVPADRLAVGLVPIIVISLLLSVVQTDRRPPHCLLLPASPGRGSSRSAPWWPWPPRPCSGCRRAAAAPLTWVGLAAIGYAAFVLHVVDRPTRGAR